MTEDLHQLAEWLRGNEDEHLEFKEAKTHFDFEKLVKYCAALANENGGMIVLGVSDKRPRQVVGTTAFGNLERTKAGLVERLGLRIELRELSHPEGRVLVFTAPPRPIGTPIAVKGAYWMRAGEDLVPMTPDQLCRIFEEAGPDFSAEVCPGATLADLAPEAVDAFRRRWHRKAKKDAILQVSGEQLLRDAELLMDEGITYAALILMGTRAALGRHLAQAELVFEYRSSEAAGPANQREEFREGVLVFYDRLWELLNLRNDLQHFQDGLFVLDVPTFDERAVREALLNAVSHRDYRDAGSVFVRQYSRRIEIVSPGGFPAGITQENLLWQQKPRNRRVAESLARCGLVERAGQGFDLIYGECIRHGKALPDFTRTDEHFVWLTLHGTIQDPAFLRFLEKVGNETQISFDLEDLLVLDLVHREQKVEDPLARRLGSLLEHGILERIGRGRGVRYLLSSRFYKALGKPGAYTRQRGLDRGTNKALLVKHIEGASPAGAALVELQEVLPALSRNQIQSLLRELKRDGEIEVRGRTKAARWFPNPKRNQTQ
ncbi:MAG: transcriptional regulator [Planctomycetota bacterium]|nr:MAG: transcriptional regulator [Planctomycetota bacterium]